ncbi:MAG: chemotaxis protein CheD [Desulfobacteraceae bacterium Eth-SRB1]|nr:MAG: chemotaxis protein CheD [Desulfobacteraceae bacterium Eth-SRB1]
MSRIIVGIADLRISQNIDDALITYALGSCIGIAVYDPGVRVGGLLHFMLPDSSLDLNKARQTPAMFADTGIPFLFKSCYRLGAKKKRMVVKIAGGANILDNSNYFRIGQRNITALRKIFWKNNVLIDGDDTGKSHNRTVQLNIFSGNVVVKNSSGIWKEL